MNQRRILGSIISLVRGAGIGLHLVSRPDVSAPRFQLFFEQWVLWPTTSVVSYFELVRFSNSMTNINILLGSFYDSTILISSTIIHYRPSIWYCFSLSFFLCTIGLVIKIANNNPETVKTSWALLKFSLNTSNVFDGATRVRNMSSPYANIRDVDSRRAGAVTIRRTLATWY